MDGVMLMAVWMGRVRHPSPALSDKDVSMRRARTPGREPRARAMPSDTKVSRWISCSTHAIHPSIHPFALFPSDRRSARPKRQVGALRRSAHHIYLYVYVSFPPICREAREAGNPSHPSRGIPPLPPGGRRVPVANLKERPNTHTHQHHHHQPPTRVAGHPPSHAANRRAPSPRVRGVAGAGGPPPPPHASLEELKAKKLELANRLSQTADEGGDETKRGALMSMYVCVHV